MKIKDITGRSTIELKDELGTLDKKLFDIRMQRLTQKMEDSTQIIKTRKDIARIKTVLRERELAESKN